VAGGGDAGERPPGGGSHVTESLELDAALPFDVGAHPQAPSAPAWLMTARLARDVRINAGRSNGARVPRVAFLLDMDLDRVCAEGGGGAARATAAREAYKVLISVREELKASDQAFMARAHANQVPPGDRQASAVRPAGPEAEASPVPDGAARVPVSHELRRRAGTDPALTPEYKYAALLASCACYHSTLGGGAAAMSCSRAD